MRNLRLTVQAIVRRFGVKILWRHAVGSSVDLSTGEKTDLTTPQSIRKSLMLPEAITEKFTYDLSYIAAGKNFVQGGFYTEGLRAIAVMKKDLSSYTLQDKVEIDGRIYRIQKSFDNPNGILGFNLVDIKNAK